MRARSPSSSIPTRRFSSMSSIHTHAGFALSSIALLALSVGAAAQAAPRQKPEKSPLDVDTVLWWLPGDTETVFVAQGPFRMMPRDPRLQPARSLQMILQATNLSALAGSEENRRFKQVLGRTVLLAVEGSRRFRPPSRLGSTLFEGCEIVQFKDEPGDNGNRLKQSFERSAKRKETLNGVQVFVYEEMLEQDLWTTFVASPKANLFLAATNESYLTEVLGRMSHRAETRALPDSLPEWKYVDRTAPFWAVRHFDPKGASQDPTSPFGGRKAANVPDDQALGAAFKFFRGQKPNSNDYISFCEFAGCSDRPRAMVCT